MALESSSLAFANLYMTHQSRVIFVGVSVVQGRPESCVDQSVSGTWPTVLRLAYDKDSRPGYL